MTILKSIVLSSSDEMEFKVDKKRSIYDRTRDVKRNHFKWSINELLRLQREYELLEYDVFEIADLHQRSVSAIVFKLNSENIIKDIYHARGLNITHEIDLDSNDDDDENISSYSNDSDYIPESDSESESESESEFYYNFKHNEYYSDCESDSDYDPDYFKKKYKNQTSANVVIDITESDSEDEDEDEDEKPVVVENVSERVEKLESSVSNMEGMLTRLYNFMMKSSSSLTMGYDE